MGGEWRVDQMCSWARKGGGVTVPPIREMLLLNACQIGDLRSCLIGFLVHAHTPE